jgi:hypothetical protein
VPKVKNGAVPGLFGQSGSSCDLPHVGSGWPVILPEPANVSPCCHVERSETSAFIFRSVRVGGHSPFIARTIETYSCIFCQNVAERTKKTNSPGFAAAFNLLQ